MESIFALHVEPLTGQLGRKLVRKIEDLAILPAKSDSDVMFCFKVIGD